MKKTLPAAGAIELPQPDFMNRFGKPRRQLHCFEIIVRQLAR
jgi:hypothetical protein